MESSAAVKMVTPEQALTWLNKASYEKQRTVRFRWVQYLADEMASGTFEQDTALTFMSVNGSLELIDGQHRLSAVAKSGLPQRFVVVIRNVDSDADVAKAYYRIDQSLKRTTVDQYRVLGLDVDLDLTPTDLNALGSAVAFISNGFIKSTGSTPMHPDDRVRLIREYADAARHYFAMKMGCPSEIGPSVKRAATVSIGVVTYQFSAVKYGLAKVDEFWNGAVFDDNVAKGDPRKLANRHFWTTGMLASGGTHFTNAVSPAYSARLLARCFNAYMQDEVLKQAKVLDTNKPIEILGSPFLGK